MFLGLNKVFIARQQEEKAFPFALPGPGSTRLGWIIKIVVVLAFMASEWGLIFRLLPSPFSTISTSICDWGIFKNWPFLPLQHTNTRLPWHTKITPPAGKLSPATNYGLLPSKVFFGWPYSFLQCLQAPDEWGNVCTAPFPPCLYPCLTWLPFNQAQ